MSKPVIGVLLALLFFSLSSPTQSEPALSSKPDLSGRWVFNQQASDDVDKLIGKAIKKSGGKIKLPKGVGRNDYERFRGGPKEQEIYDRLAYDLAFTLAKKGENYILIHHNDDEGDFEREASSKRRTRTISAKGGDIDDTSGHSFAYWDGRKLAVETRAADGGYALEQYSLLESGQLEVFLRLEPVKFPKALSFVRIFDRDASAAKDGSAVNP